MKWYMASSVVSKTKTEGRSTEGLSSDEELRNSLSVPQYLDPLVLIGDREVEANDHSPTRTEGVGAHRRFA